MNRSIRTLALLTAMSLTPLIVPPASYGDEPAAPATQPSAGAKAAA